MSRHVAKPLTLAGVACGCLVFLVGCGGGISLSLAQARYRAQDLAEYECAQLNADATVANAAADSTWAVDTDVSNLHVSALRPVSIASANGRSLPWGAMSDSQRDTWSAWQFTGAGSALDSPRDDLVWSASAAPCVPPAVGPAPDDGLSDSDLAHQLPFDGEDDEPAAIERAADRVVRGSRNGELVDALASALIGLPSYPRYAFLGSVEDSALTGPPTLAYDGDGDGYLGASANDVERGVRWSAPQLVRIVDAFGSRPATWRRFLTALAQTEARDIVAHTKTAPPSSEGPTSQTEWAERLGATNAILYVVAILPGNGRLQNNVASFADAVIRAVDGDSSAAVARELGRPPPPGNPASSLTRGLGDAITAGFVRNGVLTAPASATRNGRLRIPSDFGQDALVGLDDWLRETRPAAILNPSTTASDLAFFNRSLLACCRR
jgi:hypothetical protein